MKCLKVGVLGRTEMLLGAARQIEADGHRIAIVATCKPSDHEQTSEREFEQLAAQAGAPFFRHRELYSAEALAILKALDCDVAVSMNWLTLIPAAVRNCFRLGVLNAHPGDLPRFKGNACPNWAIISGEARVGLTIHQMVEELDAGPIAIKRSFDLEPDRTIGEVYAWLRQEVPSAFREVVMAAATGSLDFTPQPDDPTLSLRCYPRRPEDARLDWSRPVAELLRLVRASGTPFGGAFTTLESKQKVTIWRASLHVSTEPFLATPGQVAHAVEGDPVIAGRDGYIRLLDIAMDGQPDGNAAKAAILRSLRSRLG